MRKGIFQLFAALEENTNGQHAYEREFIFHAKLLDRSILKTAIDIEEQEQWTIKVVKSPSNPIAGSIRIRKTTSGGKTNYVLTTKTPAPSTNKAIVGGGLALTQDLVEISSPSTEDAFEQFKMLSTLGMIKTRHILPIEGSPLRYEVDSFKLKNGKFCEWVKIDLEVPEEIDELPTLPTCFTEVVYNQQGQRTPAEAKLVSDLYDNVFWLKNPYLD